MVRRVRPVVAPAVGAFRAGFADNLLDLQVRKFRGTALGVWMNGERVGDWRSKRNAEDEFEYEPGWFDSPARRPISLSLPMLAPGHVERGPHVASFFDNLLPDRDDIRRALQQSKRATSSSAFDLLRAVGRDCIGAIQLLPPDESPANIRSIEADPLDEAAVAAILRAAPTSQGLAGSQHDLRISLAGAQDKTALLRRDGQWMQPRGSTPTTHILKLPMGAIGAVAADFSVSVDVEHLCACLLDELGMPVAKTEIVRFEDQRVLVVERFDRRWMDGGRWIARIPQEDFCQVLKRSRDRKHESDGGPGMREIDQVLQSSLRPLEDRITFMRSQILFWLLAAIDGHAKNFSVQIRPGGAFALAPLYDVLSAYPVIGRGARQFSPFDVKLAMAPPGTKNRHYRLHEILPRHWFAACSALQLALDVDAFIAELQAALPAALERTASRLPDDFSDLVRDSIFNGVSAALGLWSSASH